MWWKDSGGKCYLVYFIICGWVCVDADNSCILGNKNLDNTFQRRGRDMLDSFFNNI